MYFIHVDVKFHNRIVNGGFSAGSRKPLEIIVYLLIEKEEVNALVII